MSPSSSADVDTTAFDAALDRLGAGPEITEMIGFTSSHAAIVHERLDVHHPQGEAKYLENEVQAAVNNELIEQSIAAEVESCTDVAELHAAVARGIEKAAVKILTGAQRRCPDKTGELAASAIWQGTGGAGSGENPAGIGVVPTVRKARK